MLSNGSDGRNRFTNDKQSFTWLILFCIVSRGLICLDSLVSSPSCHALYSLLGDIPHDGLTEAKFSLDFSGTLCTSPCIKLRLIFFRQTHPAYKFFKFFTAYILSVHALVLFLKRVMVFRQTWNLLAASLITTRWSFPSTVFSSKKVYTAWTSSVPISFLGRAEKIAHR